MPATVTDDYTEKMSARFATFDHDGDGQITMADFEGMAEGILREFGLTPDSAKGQALLEGARQYFAGLAEIADTDGDGAISREEFVMAAEQRLHSKPEGFTEVLRPWATAVIDVADADGDGTVDLEEWARMLRAMGASEQGAAQMPARMDTDGDGTISVTKVLASAKSFYIGDEPREEFDRA